jgi:hypothetical protein
MDNHHAQITGSSASCGILEVSHPDADSKKVAYSIASHLYHPSRGNPVAFAMWSDLVESNGAKLAAYLGENFGGITETSSCENPKTGNEIQVFIWTIPHEEFRKWYKETRISIAKKL